MFTAAMFTKPNYGKSPEAHQHMDKEDAVYVYIMEYYSAIPNTLLNQSASVAVIRVKGMVPSSPSSCCGKPQGLVL